MDFSAEPKNPTLRIAATLLPERGRSYLASNVNFDAAVGYQTVVADSPTNFVEFNAAPGGTNKKGPLDLGFVVVFTGDWPDG